MIYNSLDTIPYKLFIKIAETGDFTLLSDVESDVIVLSELWNKLYDEHLNKNQTSESKRIFTLSKQIDSLYAMNSIVLMACECLRFEYDQGLFDLLVGFGYQLPTEGTENYHSGIDRIERESNAYVVKAEYYQKMLPESKEQDAKKNDYSIDDVMASFCAILGFNIGDFNTVTYMAFFGYEKQVNSKIKAMNKQNEK